jgi:hypothetical protein
MPGPLYREPDAELSQGDVIDGIPQIRLNVPLTIIRRVTLRGGKDYWAPYPYPPAPGNTPDAPGKTIVQQPFNFTQGEYTPALARFTRVLVLNHDCDLVENDPAHPDRPKPEHCLVAVVRPISGVHEADRDIIRQNRNYHCFFLPSDTDLRLDEGYADFQQVTCVHPALLRAIGSRRASLTPLGVSQLHAQLYRFVTGRELIPPGPPTVASPAP